MCTVLANCGKLSYLLLFKDIDGGPYPVMVYFHGGGYSDGANVFYPGYFLASRDVVVVVVNYRVHNLGNISYSFMLEPVSDD